MSADIELKAMVSEPGANDLIKYVGQGFACSAARLMMQKYSITHELIRVSVKGKNALDFVLSSEAGKHAANNNNIVVLSKGNSKNLAPLVFRVPSFIFWLK
jgi:hypothetical protein